MAGTPPIDLLTLRGGNHTDTAPEASIASLLAASSSGLRLMTPVAEGVSVGVVPVTPDVLERGSFIDPVRRVRCRCGPVHSYPKHTKARGTWWVGWRVVLGQAYIDLREFLLGQAFDQVAGRLRPFTVAVNGADGTQLVVRPLEEPRFTTLGDGGRYRVDPFICEEVYQ